MILILKFNLTSFNHNLWRFDCTQCKCNKNWKGSSNAIQWQKTPTKPSRPVLDAFDIYSNNNNNSSSYNNKNTQRRPWLRVLVANWNLWPSGSPCLVLWTTAGIASATFFLLTNRWRRVVAIAVPPNEPRNKAVTRVNMRRNGRFHNCQSWSFITVHGQF